MRRENICACSHNVSTHIELATQNGCPLPTQKAAMTVAYKIHVLCNIEITLFAAALDSTFFQQ